MDNNNYRGRNFSRPGRGGFNGRQSNYGDQKGYNSSAFGRWTWTFYDEDQWRRFKDWLKEDARREETERNKILIRSLAEIIQSEKGSVGNKGKKSEKGKKKKERIMSDSSEEDSEESESKTDSSPEKKLKKKSSRKKKMEKLFGRLKEMEEENKRLKEKSESLVLPKKSTPKASAKISPVESEDEEVSDLEFKKKVNDDDLELLKKIERDFAGKEGTKLLKKFCTENELVYKNKTEAIWAVLAFKKGGT